LFCSWPVTFQCVLDIMSHLYYGQKVVHFLYSHMWKLWASATIVKHAYVLIVVLISLCHKQPDHFHEEEEKAIVVEHQFTWGTSCILSPLGTPVKGWTLEFQVSCGFDQIWIWLPLAAAESSSCHLLISVWMPFSLSNDPASLESFSKSGSYNVFSCLKNVVIVARISLQCHERE